MTRSEANAASEEPGECAGSRTGVSGFLDGACRALHRAERGPRRWRRVALAWRLLLPRLGPVLLSRLPLPALLGASLSCATGVGEPVDERDPVLEGTQLMQ